MKRYLKILFLNSKAVFLSTLEYRVAYIFRVARIILRFGLTYLSLNILFLKTNSFGGWSKLEVFLIYSVYQFVTSFVDFFCGDSLAEIPSLVKNGELDMILTKPLDSQFMVSFKDTHPGNIYRILISLIIFNFATSLLKGQILFQNIIFGFLFIVAAITIYYSLLLLIASVSFYVLEESLGEIFENLMSLSRYPVDILPRGIRIILTVVPVIFLVTVPSRVILGKFSIFDWLAFPVAILLFYFSRKCFLIALKSYTSAGG